MARMGRRAKTEAERAFDQEMGRRLCVARKEAHLTTAEFATRAEISVQQLYWYETGVNAIPLRRWMIFCRVLHVSLASFIQTASFNLKSENSCVGCPRNR
jgi:transcriptional regulator with XRE-family HTH domain